MRALVIAMGWSFWTCNRRGMEDMMLEDRLCQSSFWYCLPSIFRGGGECALASALVFEDVWVDAVNRRGEL